MALEKKGTVHRRTDSVRGEVEGPREKLKRTEDH